MKDYIRFPPIEHFEKFLYAVAYSTHIPAHVKLKRSHILIWRDYSNHFLRICFPRPIYPSIIQQFLRKDEGIKMFRPNAYYVLHRNSIRQTEEQIAMIQDRIARIQMDDHSKLYRTGQLLKQYLYYTTFIRALNQCSHSSRRKLMDCLEAVQGYYWLIRNNRIFKVQGL
jgi:hypothetical protein